MARATARANRGPSGSPRTHPKRPKTERAGPPQILVILNPVAPRFETETLRRTFDEAFRSRGLEYRMVETPRENAGDVIESAIEKAVKQGCTRIIAAGGDGTIAVVAEALARHGHRNSDIALAIVPVGTANVLARELGIPAGLEEAVTLAAEGQNALDLDAILIQDRHVLTQVGIGRDAMMIRDTSREQQIKLGRLAYFLAFFRRGIRHRAHRFDLEVDGTMHHVRAWQVALANIGSFGGLPLTWGPGIDPTDAAADLCVYNARSVRDYLVLALRLLTGRHRRDANARFFRVRDRVKIESDRPLLVQGDGEILGRTPVTLQVVPRWVRVLVPRPVETAPAEAPGTEVALTTTTAAPIEQAASPVAPQPSSPAPTAPAPESLAGDVESMIAERSPTWVLQGKLRHPFTALGAFDAALFLHANNLLLGPVLDRALTWISRIMHLGEGWAAVALVMILVDPMTGLKATAEALPVLWLTMLTVNYPMKALFRRHRPFTAFVDARVIGPKPVDYSFPSGHAAAAFAGAMLLGAHAPAWSPLFYGLALIVGFSRVYLGVHYPSDVVIGAFVGTLIAATYRAVLHVLVPWFS